MFLTGWKPPRAARSAAAVRAAVMSALERRVLLTTFNPVDGTGFSQALSNAQFGDTIILNAGTTYEGNFSLKDKGAGSGWITIQSSNLSALPADGVRVAPSDAANMPRIMA